MTIRQSSVYPAAKTLIVMPTYNEIETLPGVLKRVNKAVPNADILIVDDSSPDGTGQWVDDFVLQQDRSKRTWLNIMHRPAKSGLSSAYAQGFQWGLDRGYNLVGQMDSDGSHRPEELNRLLTRIQGLDHPAGVIGSRWIRGGRVSNWSKDRVAISKFGNLYIRALLGMPLTDATAGFRIYRADVLEETGVLGELTTKGYGFQAEMTYRLSRYGYRIVEVPVVFSERLAGESKMSLEIATEELCQISSWGARRLFGMGPK